LPALSGTYQKYQLIPDMISILKCGFMGEVGSIAKPKRENTSDDIKFDGEVVWSSFDRGN
jgi:hypothetical protein